MAEKATVARPYAKAAFAHARDKNALDAWSGWLGTARAVVSSDEYKSYESSPGTSRNQLRDLVANVCGDALDANGRALLDLLAENGRIDYLPEIAAHFDELKAGHQNGSAAHATGRRPARTTAPRRAVALQRRSLVDRRCGGALGRHAHRRLDCKQTPASRRRTDDRLTHERLKRITAQAAQCGRPAEDWQHVHQGF